MRKQYAIIATIKSEGVTSIKLNPEDSWKISVNNDGIFREGVALNATDEVERVKSIVNLVIKLDTTATLYIPPKIEWKKAELNCNRIFTKEQLKYNEKIEYYEINNIPEICDDYDFCLGYIITTDALITEIEWPNKIIINGIAGTLTGLAEDGELFAMEGDESMWLEKITFSVRQI